MQLLPALLLKVQLLRSRCPEDAKDDVASGLHGNLIAQRLKLNGRVALVTGVSRCAPAVLSCHQNPGCRLLHVKFFHVSSAYLPASHRQEMCSVC